VGITNVSLQDVVNGVASSLSPHSLVPRSRRTGADRRDQCGRVPGNDSPTECVNVASRDVASLPSDDGGVSTASANLHNSNFEV
jgi:hypothetical protein